MIDLTLRPVPCRSCPYRKDCPPGVWAENEYRKLPEYDRETFNQPFGVFLCHDADRESVVCRGWAEVHVKQPHDRALIALRVSTVEGIDDMQPCGVELWESGQAACDHGLSRIADPPPDAIAMSERIAAKHGLNQT